jgi:hypothetical protein
MGIKTPKDKYKLMQIINYHLNIKFIEGKIQ